jgi:hypothetical protein
VKRVPLRDVALAVGILAAVNAVILAVVAGTSGRPGLVAFFAWPAGSVWSNLLASAILGGFSLYLVLRKMARNHAERLAQAQAHHNEAGDHRDRLHAAVLAHVEKVAGK